MPGPVSDSYDPEWGTSANAELIHCALQDLYDKLSAKLGDKPPIYILDLVKLDLPMEKSITLTEKELRLLRFALERSQESL